MLLCPEHKIAHERGWQITPVLFAACLAMDGGVVLG